MKITALFIFLSALIAGHQASGQEDLKVVRNEFRTDKPGFDEAWKSLSRGDKLYTEGVLSYQGAIEEYSRAHQYNSENAELNYKLGVCYLFTSNREKSLDFFLKALSLKPAVAPDILLLTGRAYHYNGRFIEGVGKYTEFLENDTRKDPATLERVRKYIDEGNSGMVISRDTVRIGIENAGDAINSPFDDYSPVLSDDALRLYYASRRPLLKTPKGKYDDALPDENILISTFTDEKWEYGLPVEGKLNTAYCEAPLELTGGGDILYLYVGYKGEGDIYSSTLKNGVWKKPRPARGGVNTLYPETSITFSPSGEEMVFISARKKGTVGGKDIYLSTRVKDKRWGRPVNLTILNSMYDEESVRFSKGGDTLWFSSQGHSSIGGFDIFLSTRQPDGSWSAPINAGIPVNTVYDDIYYTPSMVCDSTFWLVSNRSGGLGALDLYTGRLLPPEPEPEPEPDPEPVIEPVIPEPVRVTDTVFVIREVVKEVIPVVKETEFYLEGRILDSTDETPVVARIDIIDPDTYQVIASLISTEEKGDFRVNVKVRKNYMVEVRSNGYLSDMRKIDIPAGYIGSTFFTNFYLDKIVVGKKVVLNNIFFETGKSVLTPQSYAELDKLTVILKESPTMRIEISGHTDNTGSATINDRLSLERARAVSTYLTGQGVEATRIESKGFGSSQPIETNATPAGRAANRRVEFKILEL